MTAFTQKSIKLILCCCFIIALVAIPNSVLLVAQKPFIPENVSVSSSEVLPGATKQIMESFPGRTINLHGNYLSEAGTADIIAASIIIDGRLTRISFSQYFITEILYISA